MLEELRALDKNHTWDVIKLPRGQHAVGCKWVIKTKLRSNGEVERYKARLVAKGYS